MRLSVSRALLAEHMQTVAKAVPGKINTSVPEGVLLESSDEVVTIAATNLEIGIRTSFTAPHEASGKVVLPAKIIEIIKRLPGDIVDISVDENSFLTEIKSEQSEFQIYGLSAEEFPLFPEFSPEEAQYSFQVEAAYFKRALKQTLFAVSHDEGKPAFTGIYLTFNESELFFAASDTFRLAATSCPVSFSGKKISILVPAKNLQEVIRIFGEEEKTIEGVIVKNQLLLSSGERKIFSRLLDENFPNIERVIPKNFIGQALIKITPFLHALERAALLSEGMNYIARISISEGIITIRAASKYGKIQETVEVQYQGEDMELSLNMRFIIDMLKVCEGEYCILKINGQNKPCVFIDSLHEDYIYLVLPIRVDPEIKENDIAN